MHSDPRSGLCEVADTLWDVMTPGLSKQSVNDLRQLFLQLADCQFEEMKSKEYCRSLL